jgi:hypothetical protein
MKYVIFFTLIYVFLTVQILNAQAPETGLKKDRFADPIFVSEDIVTDDTIEFTIVLAEIPGTLTFNQHFVSMNSLEYEWCIEIDKDNNASTGDPDGFEVCVSLNHYKDGTSFSSSILAAARGNTWILNSSGGGRLGHLLNVDVSIPLKTITLSGMKSWSEFNDFTQSSKWRIHTYYWGPGVFIHDYSVPAYGKTIVYDDMFDVNYGFIDIVGGQVTVLAGPTTLDVKRNEIPTEFCLSQNYPNPFNPTTIIEFDLPKSSEVSLKIYNILGKEIATLVSDRLSAGSYSYEWDASNLTSGVYLYRLQAGNYVDTRKMVLMR